MQLWSGWHFAVLPAGLLMSIEFVTVLGQLLRNFFVNFNSFHDPFSRPFSFHRFATRKRGFFARFDAWYHSILAQSQSLVKITHTHTQINK
jgi:hypothetical protein